MSSLNESCALAALPSVDQFARLVEESSLKQPKILTGQVQFFADTDVYLLWVKEVQSKKLLRTISPSKTVIEKPTSLVPISMKVTIVKQGSF